MKIRNTQSHEFEQKPMLAPITSVNVPKFLWLCNVFLKYFQGWLNSVEQRQVNFTKDARQKMFISSQTYEGLKITVNSITEATQFPLQHQIRCVLTEHFCQDPVENYFGRQRSLGLKKDNPSMADFVYNDNAKRNQNFFEPITHGNAADCGMVGLTNEPLPCRKKSKRKSAQERCPCLFSVFRTGWLLKNN